MVFVAIFATFLMVVLFTAVKSVHADVIRPEIGPRLISVGAAGVSYDASSGVLSIHDETAAFSLLTSLGGVPHFIYNLSDAFGGGYDLNALFATMGTNASLDGYFTTLDDDADDLVITGKIPSLGITPDDNYTGTLLTANVVTGELFAYGTTNASAEYNLYFVVTGGDLVTAGHYSTGEMLGELSVLLSLNPKLPGGFAFDTDFDAVLQSGSVGQLVPEPVTLFLVGSVVPLIIGIRRRKALKE